MTAKDKEAILKILDKELAPALGCTEPAAYAYVAALARSHVEGTIKEVVIDASAAMIKGVQYVTVPGTPGLRGGKISSALGLICGHPDRQLEILNGMSAGDIAAAQAMVDSGMIRINRVANPVHSLYLLITVITDQGEGAAAVACTSTDVVYLRENDKVLLDRREQVRGQTPDEDDSLYQVLSMPNIHAFAVTARREELAPIQRAIEMNCAIAEDGMANPYGMEVGRKLREKAGSGLISMDLCTVAMMWGAAGVDARMGGSMLPAMCNCGSGNQGIACTAPVWYVGQYLKKEEEDILRAVTVANLVNIFVKTHTGKKNSRMAGTCCAAVAAGGAGCGIALLKGATEKQLELVLKSVLGNVAGLFCDGAKSNCALRVSSTMAGAIQCALLALEDIGAGEFDGLVGRSVEETIRNFYRIQIEGMKEVKEVLFEIEKDKHGIC